MIDVCEELDLTFNAKKSSIVRVGKKYKNECAAIISYVILIYLVGVKNFCLLFIILYTQYKVSLML